MQKRSRVDPRVFSADFHAVVVGISAYNGHNGLRSLLSPASDAIKIADALADKAGCAIPTDQITLLTDLNATKANILDRLRIVLDKVTPFETIFIYFAGHGIKKDERLFLCTCGTSEDTFEASTISGEELDAILSKTRARGVFIVLDCCRSAGFAESAPTFFRTIGESEFRILLSASRASQQSWELPTIAGTLFSRYLIRALKGEDSVGNIPGAIYFSDLLSYLQEQVEEALKTNFSDAPRQDPVFTGVYAKAPLVFTNRHLTRQQILLKTARYSTEFIRQRTRRTLAGILFALFCLAGFCYTYLEHSHFLQLTENGITLWQGIRRFPAFGFPKQQWTFDLKADDTASSSPLHIGKSVSLGIEPFTLPMLLPHLDPVARAMVLDWNQQKPTAAQLLRQYLTQSDAATEARFEKASELFSDLAEANDIGLLTMLTQHRDSNVQINAIRALLRVAPAVGLETASHWVPHNYAGPNYSDESSSIILTELPGHLPGVSQQTIAAYLAHCLRTRGGDHVQLEALDASLRTGIPISSKDLVEALLVRAPGRTIAFGMYAQVENRTDLVPLLLARLPQLQGNSLSQVVSTLALAPGRTCNDGLYQLAMDPSASTDIRASSLEALLHGCPEFRRKHLDNKTLAFLSQNLELIPVLARAGLVSDAVVINAMMAPSQTAYPIRQTSYIDVLGPSADSLKLLQRIALNEQLFDAVRERAMHRLYQLNISPDPTAIQNLLASNSGVLTAAATWYGKTHPREIVKHFLANIDNPKANYIEEFLGTTPLTPDELDMIRSKLSYNAITRSRAIAVLAMQGSPQEIVSFLTAPDPGTRRITVKYVGYNPHLSDIVRLLNGVATFPDNTSSALKQLLQIRNGFEFELSRFSGETRQWRQDLIRRTHNLPTGLSLWLARPAFYWEYTRDLQ